MTSYRVLGRPTDASYYTIQEAHVGDVIDLDPNAADTQALLNNGAIEQVQEGASDVAGPADPAATAESDPAVADPAVQPQPGAAEQPDAQPAGDGPGANPGYEQQ